MSGPTSGVEELSNLPLSSLFAGPLVAAVDASVHAQEASLQLLLETAYDEDGSLATVAFEYATPEVDPETGERGEVQRRLEVPLVLFLSLPTLQISRIEESFSAEISSLEAPASGEAASEASTDGESRNDRRSDDVGSRSIADLDGVAARQLGTLSLPPRLRVKPAPRSTEYDRSRRSKFDLDVTMVAELTNESTGAELLGRAANTATRDLTVEESDVRSDGGRETVD